MSRYKAWLKRVTNATPYANEATCTKCKHSEWIRTAAFCNGRGRPRKLTQREWNATIPGFCPEYEPRT